MAPPIQGFRHIGSLSAAASDKTGALFATCGASRGGGIQLSGTWTATVVFEQSLDGGTTWIAKTVYPATGGAGVTTAAANGQWKFRCGGATHIRARCSAFSSGPIVVDLALTAGDDAVQAATLLDASGAAVAYGFTPVEITTKTTTLVKSGAGMIGSLTVNTLGSADTITVYDALTATGTPIATIAAPLTVGLKFCEGYLFSVGCCVVTGGTTAGKYTVAVA